MAMAAGHTVFGLRRSDAALPDGVERIQADLSDPGSIPALPAVDAVLMAVGADGRSESEYRSAYVDGPGNLAAALGGVRREVVLSSTGVFGADDGRDVGVEAAPEPTTVTGRVLLEAEEAAFERGATVLRLAGIYGPGRVRLLRTIRDGTAWQRGNLDAWSNLIHRDDAAGLSLRLLELDAPPKVVHGVDDTPTVRRELLAGLAELMGVEAPGGGEAEATRGKRVLNGGLGRLGYALKHGSWKSGYAELVPTSTRAYARNS